MSTFFFFFVCAQEEQIQTATVRWVNSTLAVQQERERGPAVRTTARESQRLSVDVTLDADSLLSPEFTVYRSLVEDWRPPTPIDENYSFQLAF